MRERLPLFVILALVTAAALAFLFWPRVRQELAPTPVGALVAIAAGDGPAVVGPVELPAGEEFRLHAVLVAQARDGSRVYYTEAPALVIGGEPVPAAALRPWQGGEEVKVLWFTVEGNKPFVELEPGQEVSDGFTLREVLRPQWPQTATIPGRLEPANDDSLVREGARVDNPFGTQRYHARIEIYDRSSRFIPVERYKSPAAVEALEDPGSFPTVVASLPGELAPASVVFGLTQIQPPAEAPRELQERIVELAAARLAFSQITVIDAMLRRAGVTVGQLGWRRIDLEAGPPWGGAVAPGSLLRVGDRVVVLYEDQGQPGILDRQDLVFDYVLGAAVRPLSAVFGGGGEVELAPLAPAA